MESSIRDDVNFTSLVELFGTFFEKVTNVHSQKDALGKHLYEFKQMLYTNKSNLTIVDHYLDDLRKKTQASGKIDVKTLSSEKPSSMHQKGMSPKYQQSNPVRNFKTFDPEVVKLGLKPQKFDLHTVADFIKTRQLEHANPKQSLLRKYSHVREFELDSSNFYRLIAIGTITHLIHDPNSQPRFTEIIEDVISRKIVLKNYYYSYSHEEYANMFCGYLEQLVKAKNSGQAPERVLELFHEMIKYDHLFNIALLCYLKGKLVNFATDILPKITGGETQGLWDQLQSPDIGEKILNNNPMVIEPLLNVLPYLLNLKIVTQVIEGGTLYERIYSKNLLNATGEQFVMRSSEISGPAIHLLIEKVFTTSNYYLLLPSEGKSMNNSSDISQAKTSAVVSSTHSASVKGNEPSPNQQENEVKKLAIEVSDSPRRKVSHNPSTRSFCRPKDDNDRSKFITDSPTAAPLYKKRDLSAPRPRSTCNFTQTPRYFLTPSRLRPLNLNLEPLKPITRSEKKPPAADISEIINNLSITNQANRSNEKENNGTRSHSKLQSSQTGNNELKDRTLSVNTPSGRPSLPKNPMLQIFGRDNTPKSNSKQSEKKQIGDVTRQVGDFTRQVDLVNAVVTSDKTQTENESPYDAYIKTRTQTSAFEQSTAQLSATSTANSTQQPSTTSSALAQSSGNASQPTSTAQETKSNSSGFTGTSTPYDNYISIYGRSYLNPSVKGIDYSSSITPHSRTTNAFADSLKGMTSSASTSSIQTTSTSSLQTNKYGTSGYFASSSPSKNIFRGTSSSNSQTGYSSLGTFNGNSSSNSSKDIDQMLKDRFKNMFTLAPRSNDTLPLNPFSQSVKYTGTSVLNETKDLNDTTTANSSYSYSTKYNFDSLKIPKYGASYSQQDKVPTTTTTKETQGVNLVQETINPQKIAPTVPHYNVSNVSNRFSGKDTVSVKGS